MCEQYESVLTVYVFVIADIVSGMLLLTHDRRKKKKKKKRIHRIHV